MPAELQAMMERGGVRVIDTRREPEGRQIKGAERYLASALERIDHLPFTPGERLVVYCEQGNASRRTAAALRSREYEAAALDGGFDAWQAQGLPTEPVTPLIQLPASGALF